MFQEGAIYREYQILVYLLILRFYFQDSLVYYILIFSNFLRENRKIDPDNALQIVVTIMTYMPEPEDFAFIRRARRHYPADNINTTCDVVGKSLIAGCHFLLWWIVVITSFSTLGIKLLVDTIYNKILIGCAIALQYSETMSETSGRRRVIPDRRAADDYLVRYYLLLRDRAQFPFNVFIHKFIKGDDDKDLHDHPWGFAHIILSGGYWEYVLEDPTDDNNTNIRKVWRGPGYWNVAGSDHKHRIELLPGTQPWTIFIPFKQSNDWGFWRILEENEELPNYASEQKGMWYKIPHEKYLELAAIVADKKDD